MNEIWTEKYRPRTLDDVVGQKHVSERLKAYVASRNMPHLMFTGPAGTGKTTCSLALAKEMFGGEWRGNFIELNASDERGIDVVRGKIKEFARTAPLGGAEFKIIFMDEADALTSDAQAALRRTMEKYSSICRFILSCNYSSKIIDPIQSRCAVFRFKPLSAEDVEAYLRKIVAQENIQIDDDAMKGLVMVARGDMRRAVNSLQVAASLGKKIDLDLIYQTIGMANPEIVKNILETALGGNFVKARDTLENVMIEYGLSGQDIIRQIHSTFFDLSLSDSEKVRLVDKTGEIEFRIVEGSNERIQLEALLAYLVMIGGNRRRRRSNALRILGSILSEASSRTSRDEHSSRTSLSLWSSLS
ncbi:MAG: replication factor C small subunit [Candidatus Methanomethylophilaceae archaeon]|jgi:replication factor C small subunit|nr:replication factor C small subunit [Candidatus Methanomethylophilaceae archaeon]